LREKLKTLIGDALITDEYAQKIGTDAEARDVAHGVRICTEWLGRNNRKWLR
jgi:methanogenic corrinoid protein MtbC1